MTKLSAAQNEGPPAPLSEGFIVTEWRRRDASKPFCCRREPVGDFHNSAPSDAGNAGGVNEARLSISELFLVSRDDKTPLELFLAWSRQPGCSCGQLKDLPSGTRRTRRRRHFFLRGFGLPFFGHRMDLAATVV
jgi:hypothetical protein